LVSISFIFFIQLIHNELEMFQTFLLSFTSCSVVGFSKGKKNTGHNW